MLSFDIYNKPNLHIKDVCLNAAQCYFSAFNTWLSRLWVANKMQDFGMKYDKSSATVQ